MNEREKFIAKSAVQFAATHLRRVSVAFWKSSSSQGVRPLRRQQSSSHQIQIRQRERRVQPRRILRQAAIANFAEAPQALNHMEDMFDARPRGCQRPYLGALRTSIDGTVPSIMGVSFPSLCPILPLECPEGKI